MPSSLNLQSMKIFLAVLDLRSVNGAARALGLSQSGLSTALARLRRELGDPLFIGTATGMQPTARAKSLAPAMREAVQCIEQRILKKDSFDAASDRREFRIALSDVAEAIYLPRVLRALAKVGPHVRIRTVSPPQQELQRTLSEGSVDFALGYFPDLLASEFVRRKIGQHAFVCICSVGNRRLIDDFSLRSYSEARHIVIESPGRTEGLLERYVRQRGIERTIALTTPHVMCLPELIADSDLIASIPNALAHVFSESAGLERLELPFRSPVFDTHVHWSRSVHTDPAHRWMRNTMFAALA